MTAPESDAAPLAAGERVVVAMSGGVDSSVAAALVSELGYEAVGVTMHLSGSESRCCSLADADDARRVADSLGMRFYVANYTASFRTEVMESFADAYLEGRTPIPCIPCNTRFKFDHLLERASMFGAARVATGHYARIESDSHTGDLKLLRAVDRRKDQTYFLFELTQEQLQRAWFPLGGMSKADVRDRARTLGLATAEKPESQEICFVPDGDYAAVVERLRPEAALASGEIVDQSGAVLGRHAGIHHFTVGQRKGLGLSSPEPLYVRRIEAKSGRIVVAPLGGLNAVGARLEKVSWVAGDAPSGSVKALVKVRHGHEGVGAVVESADGEARLHFDEPVRAVTPGQAAVFYQGEEVLGGGWIAEGLS